MSPRWPLFPPSLFCPYQGAQGDLSVQPHRHGGGNLQIPTTAAPAPIQTGQIPAEEAVVDPEGLGVGPMGENIAAFGMNPATSANTATAP